MTKEVRYKISNEKIFPAMMEKISNMILGGLQAGPVVVVLTRENRTLPQNDHIHPIVRKIGKYMMEHGAPKRSEEWWRYYLVGKWQGQEILPDPLSLIDINDFNIRPETFIVMNKSRTSELTKEQASEFLEWLYSFANDIGANIGG